MTILSSIKPLWSGDDYDDAQKRAVDSWKSLGFKVVLFNHPSEVMMDGVIYEQPVNSPPTIRQMLEWFVKNGSGICAIVNGDITLGNGVKIVNDIEDRLGNVWAATSFRFEVNGGDMSVVDMGLDFFAFTKSIAAPLVSDIPDFLTLGRGGWDNWMNGWLAKNLPRGRYYDLTDHKFVIHPKHDREDGRLSRYTDDQVLETFSHPRIKHCGVPRNKFHK